MGDSPNEFWMREKIKITQLFFLQSSLNVHGLIRDVNVVASRTCGGDLQGRKGGGRLLPAEKMIERVGFTPRHQHLAVRRFMFIFRGCFRALAWYVLIVHVLRVVVRPPFSLALAFCYVLIHVRLTVLVLV